MPERFSIHTFNISTEITRERMRQIEREGRSAEADDLHILGQLARAASCYAMLASFDHEEPAYRGAILGHLQSRYWPFHTDSFKPKNPRRDLIRAAALIVAEIERLDRAAGTAPA